MSPFVVRKSHKRKSAIIILEDGTTFFGKSIGIDGTAFGEVCFNTGMTHKKC